MRCPSFREFPCHSCLKHISYDELERKNFFIDLALFIRFQQGFMPKLIKLQEFVNIFSEKDFLDKNEK